MLVAWLLLLLLLLGRRRRRREIPVSTTVRYATADRSSVRVGVAGRCSSSRGKQVAGRVDDFGELYETEDDVIHDVTHDTTHDIIINDVTYGITGHSAANDMAAQDRTRQNREGQDRTG